MMHLQYEIVEMFFLWMISSAQIHCKVLCAVGMYVHDYHIYNFMHGLSSQETTCVLLTCPNIMRTIGTYRASSLLWLTLI